MISVLDHLETNSLSDVADQGIIDAVVNRFPAPLPGRIAFLGGATGGCAGLAPG